MAQHAAPMDPHPTSELDPFSPEFRADPYPGYAALRALGPAVWLARHGIWAVTDDAHARAVLTDHGCFSNAGGSGLANDFLTPPWRPPSIILNVDPPQHDRTRAVLARVLAPAAIRGLRRAFIPHARRLADAALDQGRIDAFAALARPFAVQVFADAVGLPPDDRDMLLTYGAMVSGGFGPQTAWHTALLADAPRVSAWIDARCRRDALTDGGLGARIHDAAGRGEITEAEAMLLVRSLLSAGIDTSIEQIGRALRALARHPAQWARLRADPGRARAAFDEATRYDTASQTLFRTTLGSIVFGGVAMQRHQKVLVLLGSACRDPARWTEPDRFDIGRVTTGHLGYGAGVHSCVAQMLARLEGEVLLGALAERVARLEPDDADQATVTGRRDQAQLPLRLVAA